MKPIEFDFVCPYNQLHYSSHTISYVPADVFVMVMFVSNERSCLASPGEISINIHCLLLSDQDWLFV